MTISPPGSAPNDPPPEISLQLELFAPDESDQPPTGRGLSRTHARASVPPGWWRLVDILYEACADELVVERCEEIDGEIVLAATPREGVDFESAEHVLRLIRERATNTCGCCGKMPAAPYRATIEGPTRVVCARCRERLRAGEAYLQVADSHWRLDGSPRPPQRTAGAPKGAIVHPPPGATPTERRSPTMLSPGALRRTIAAIRQAMLGEIVGQNDAVDSLALLAGLHVGGGLARGGRALVLGPSGVGKSSLIAAMRRAVEEVGYDLAWVVTDCLDLTSPGWSGAPSIGALLAAAFDGAPPDSPRAQHAVIVLDELHHAALIPGVHGNMAAKRREVLASLLGLAGHGTLHLGEGTTEWSSRHALVIAMGAFTDLLDTSRAPTASDLVRAGIPLELATRFTEQVVLLRPLPEAALRTVLRRWPSLVSLAEVCHRLGHTVQIHEEAIARAARAVTSGRDGSTARTAGGWLVTALRQALSAAIAEPEPRALVITPDSLEIPFSGTRRAPPDDPPEPNGGWDTTMSRTPH